MIDGSTSKTASHITYGMTNGRYCMTLIREYVERADKALACPDFCKGVTDYVRSHYPPELMPHLEHHPEDRLTASCIVYSNHRREIWMVGDCQCLVGGAYYDNPKPDEARIAAKRAEMAHRLLDSGKATVAQLRNVDTARLAIVKDLIKSMENQNKTYAVVDGFDIPLNKVRIISLYNTADEVVLATDGYPYLLPTLADSETALKEQLDADPLNIGAFKATKGCMAGNNSFDDRTYIRFKQ